MRGTFFPSKRTMLRVSARLKDRRNRGEPHEVTLMCVESDMREAGLGALAARRRQEPRDGIRRFKEQDFLTGLVCYVLRAYRAPSRRIVPTAWEDIPVGADYSTLTIQTEAVPERKSALFLKANPRRLYDDDSYRSMIAHELMRARRDQRGAT